MPTAMGSSAPSRDRHGADSLQQLALGDRQVQALGPPRREAVQPAAGGHPDDSEHRGDLRRLQLLPSSQQQDLPIVLRERAERRHHRTASRRRGGCGHGRRELLAQALGETLVGPLPPVVVGQRPPCNTVQPQARLLARTITEQRAGIEAAITHGLSNARVEAINTQIRLITRRAFGFHSPQARIALAMLSLADLCPPLPGR
jgi:hypothetical protein